MQVDRRFHVGYKFASKSRYHSQRTPRICRYIGYGKSDIKIGLNALYQSKDVIILKKLKKP
jgi:hypothetical protein